MSKATKFKYVAKEILEEFPEPDENHPIMKVVSTHGNNLHEVESPTGQKVLCNMPPKFQKRVWIKKGDYVIIEYVKEITKVQADIMHILYADQIRNIKQKGLWPAEWDDEKDKPDNQQGREFEDDDPAMFVNTNRRPALESSESEEEEE
eukprot:comp11435_c0_seq1/m.5848 comp11435_c0_seq1/g.5848  ORF comp11435_c0_seq1/g.5848 comp11435_c0_seq1/m.5848 type:complete len:149 (-) comp11435_c0_seq1:141-587(-)